MLVSSSDSSFVNTDYKILSSHYVTSRMRISLNLHHPIRSILHTIELARRIARVDLVYVWFADKNALIAILISRLLNRKSIVVVGGFELAALHDIGYGQLLTRQGQFVTRHVLRGASRILPVSDGLKREVISELGGEHSKVLTIATGYDSRVFSPAGSKEDIVLTVAIIMDRPRAELKGIFAFVKLAEKMPGVSFVIIGANDVMSDDIRRKGLANLRVLGQLPQQKMLEYYQRSKVYCQLSQREGLPNALCEAMLCECVPVGSKTEGVADVIGDAGFIAPIDDISELANILAQALVSDIGKRARRRISDKYNITQRESKLLRIIDEVVIE